MPWQGPVFVLTHHPEDAPPADGVTFLSCDVAEAVRIGLEAAGGTRVQLDLVDDDDPQAAVTVRYRPNRHGQEVGQ